MTPHLHPRSRTTSSLFAATLMASFFVVGLPHLFPCPAPRRTLADSEMMVTEDGQQMQRTRRRRRRDLETSGLGGSVPGQSLPAADDEVSTFLHMEEEAARMEKYGRECPVPKPGGIVGEILGFASRGKE